MLAEADDISSMVIVVSNLFLNYMKEGRHAVYILRQKTCSHLFCSLHCERRRKWITEQADIFTGADHCIPVRRSTYRYSGVSGFTVKVV